MGFHYDQCLNFAKCGQTQNHRSGECPLCRTKVCDKCSRLWVTPKPHQRRCTECRKFTKLKNDKARQERKVLEGVKNG